METNMKKESAKKTKTGTSPPLSKSAIRRQREREQRYQTILKAAETLFARAGYHKASMEQIADKAEVSVGTVYFYFKNKEDLLIHLMDQIGFKLRNMLGEEFEKSDFSVEGFRRAGQIFFEDFCPNHPEWLAILFRESAGQSPQVEGHRKKIFDKLIDDVKAALLRLEENNGVHFQSPLSAEVMAVSIMGMYERIAYHYLLWQDDRSQDLKTIGEDAVGFIVGGIGNLCREP
jgi:AcrR family transcriptional regulator